LNFTLLASLLTLSLSKGIVYNVFEAVDVITLIRGGVYDDLNLSVGDALKKRPAVSQHIYSPNDCLDIKQITEILTEIRIFLEYIPVLSMMG
jgi:hypothetical protein